MTWVQSSGWTALIPDLFHRIYVVVSTPFQHHPLRDPLTSDTVLTMSPSLPAGITHSSVLQVCTLLKVVERHLGRRRKLSSEAKEVVMKLKSSRNLSIRTLKKFVSKLCVLQQFEKQSNKETNIFHVRHRFGFMWSVLNYNMTHQMVCYTEPAECRPRKLFEIRKVTGWTMTGDHHPITSMNLTKG